MSAIRDSTGWVSTGTPESTSSGPCPTAEAAAALRLRTTMAIRRLAGAAGSAGSNGIVSANPTTRTIFSGARPPATSSRREAFARLVDSSPVTEAALALHISWHRCGR